MSTDTKDAPAKTPAKGFSLRSRLLGIPQEGEPEAEKSAVDTQAESHSEGDSVARTAAAEPVTETVSPPVNSSQTDDDETEEADEPPRVGMALAPKRSLLSMAFGLGDKKARADKPKAEDTPAPEPVPAAAEPVTVEPEVVAEPEPEPVAVEQIEEVDVAPEFPEEPQPEPQSVEMAEAEVAEATVPEPEPVAPEPARSRMFSVFPNMRSQKRPEPEPEPVAPEPVAELETPVRDESVLPVEVLPSPIEVDEPQNKPVPFVRFADVRKTYDGIKKNRKICFKFW